jgi:hypothetical protein
MTDRMSDVATPNDIQAAGQLPSLDQIDEPIAALTRRAAEARRTVLECEWKSARRMSSNSNDDG